MRNCFTSPTRFPNPACMKIAGYWKAREHDVKLLDSYEEVYGCDQVPLKKSIRSLDRILSCGGKVKMSWDKQRGGERHVRIYR